MRAKTIFELLICPAGVAAAACSSRTVSGYYIAWPEQAFKRLLARLLKAQFDISPQTP